MENLKIPAIVIIVILNCFFFLSGYLVGHNNFADLPLFSVQVSKNPDFNNIVFNISNQSWNDLLKEEVVNNQGLMRWDLVFWRDYVVNHGFADKFNAGDQFYVRLWVGEL
jgi:hypothetical protein